MSRFFLIKELNFSEEKKSVSSNPPHNISWHLKHQLLATQFELHPRHFFRILIGNLVLLVLLCRLKNVTMSHLARNVSSNTIYTFKHQIRLYLDQTFQNLKCLKMMVSSKSLSSSLLLFHFCLFLMKNGTHVKHGRRVK